MDEIKERKEHALVNVIGLDRKLSTKDVVPVYFVSLEKDLWVASEASNGPKMNDLGFRVRRDERPRLI